MTYSSYTAKVSAHETVLFQLKQNLVNRGWIVKSSSDGTTFNSSGDQITTDTSGNGGLANTNSWIRIQCPSMGGITREFTFQRTSTTNYRIKYSYSSGFSGGTPSASQTPSAGDEKIYLGGGTDAAPTFAAFFGANTSKYVGISTGDSSEGYSFFAYATDTSNVTTHFFMMDRISVPSVSVGDVDGYCIFFATTTIVETQFPTNCFSYFKKGLSGEGFVATPLFNWSDVSFGFTTTTLGSSAHNNKCVLLPVFYARDIALATPNGYKGFSHMVTLKTAKINNFATLHVSSERDHIVADILVLPWDGSIAQY